MGEGHGQYVNKKILSVHRIHYLLGKYGGMIMMNALNHILAPEMLSHEYISNFRELTYSHQVNDTSTNNFKRLMNYFINPKWQEQILDSLMDNFLDENELIKRTYLTVDQIKEIQDHGMIIGNHSVSHPVFSKLGYDEQKMELFDSFNFLTNLIQPNNFKLFCFPYGRFYTYSETTLKLLEDANCNFSFTTEQKDLTCSDIVCHPLELPRQDCNIFPFGKASYG
jgi:hypothetical protein